MLHMIRRVQALQVTLRERAVEIERLSRDVEAAKVRSALNMRCRRADRVQILLGWLSAGSRNN